MKTLIILWSVLVVMQQQGHAQGNWHAVNFPNYSLSHYGIDISFINDSTGWMASSEGSIFKTSDGGDNWDSIALISTQSQLRSIEFVNDTLGFCGSLSSSTLAPGCLFKTVDGGLTWAQVTNLPMFPDEGVCGIEKYGSRVIAVGSVNTPAWFYKSDDYGITWIKTDLSAYASTLIDCNMINSDTILVTGSANSVDLYRTIIIRSTDGGSTWQQVFASQFANSYGWKMFINRNGKGLCSVQKPAIPDSITVGYTDDFGQTWQEMLICTLTTSFNGAAGVCFFNDSIAWVSSEYFGLTYETRNGGLTWDSIPVVEGVNRFVMLDSATVLAPGSASVYKYDNSLVSVSPETVHNHTPLIELKTIPNLVNNFITIEATAWRNVLGRIKIIDTNGKVVTDFGRQFFTKGKNILQHTFELPAGNYRALWICNDGYTSSQFTVIK